MPSQGFRAALGIIAGILAALVLLYVLVPVEIHIVPGLIERIVFHGDPSAGFPVGFFVVGAAVILIPVNIGLAILFGYGVYKALRRF
jgi:hypothetical protein